MVNHEVEDNDSSSSVPDNTDSGSDVNQPLKTMMIKEIKNLMEKTQGQNLL